MAELSESAVYVSTQQNKSWIGNTYLYVSAVKNRGETGTPSIYATVRNTGTMVDGYSIFASIKSKTAFVCADIDTRVTRGNDRLAIVAPGLLDNGVWLQDGSFSVNCGGGLSGTASAYKVFNGRWTGYCNYFHPKGIFAQMGWQEGLEPSASPGLGHRKRRFCWAALARRCGAVRPERPFLRTESPRRFFG